MSGLSPTDDGGRNVGDAGDDAPSTAIPGEDPEEHIPESLDDDTETIEVLDDPAENDVVRGRIDPLLYYSSARCFDPAVRAREGDPGRGPLTVRVRARIATNAAGGGATTPRRIMDDMRELNRAFGPTGIRFQLVGDVERLAPDDDTYASTAAPGATRVAMRLRAGGDLHALRADAMPIVYVESVTGAGGFAVLASTAAPADGVVMTSNVDALTISHELGHALGLSHTHECYNDRDPTGPAAEVESRTGDEIPDTPPDPGRSDATCAPDRNTWGPAAGTCDTDGNCQLDCGAGPVADDTLPRNVMSYYQGCRQRFTTDQLRFMRCSVASDVFAAMRCESGCACGDGTCGAGETSASCARDCGCGNGLCDDGETNASCAADCDPPRCGDGTCDPGEGCLASTNNGAHCPLDCGACRGTCDDTGAACTCATTTACNCPSGSPCTLDYGAFSPTNAACVTGNPRATPQQVQYPGSGLHCGGAALREAYRNEAVNIGFYPFRAISSAPVRTGERGCVSAGSPSASRPGAVLLTLAPGEAFLRQSARNPRCWNNPPLRGPRIVTERDPRTGASRRVAYVFGYAPRAQASGWVEASRLVFDGYAPGVCLQTPGRFVVSANPYDHCQALGCTNPRTCRQANPASSPGQCGGHSVAARDVRTVRARVALQYAARGEIRAWLHPGDRVRVRYIDANGVAFVQSVSRGCRLGVSTGWVAPWALSDE